MHLTEITKAQSQSQSQFLSEQLEVNCASNFPNVHSNIPISMSPRAIAVMKAEQSLGIALGFGYNMLFGGRAAGIVTLLLNLGLETYATSVRPTDATLLRSPLIGILAEAEAEDRFEL